MKPYIYIIGIALTFLYSCSQAETIQPVDDGEMITVKLNMQASGIVSTGGDTRAPDPLPAESENLIHDIWVVQYVNDVIAPAATIHYRNSGEPGVMKIEDFPVTLRTTAGQDCVIYFLVNLRSDIPDVTNSTTVPDNIYAFQRLKIAMDLDPGVAGHFGYIYMLGRYVGPIDNATESLNILLGRLGARINLRITNSTGEELTDMAVRLKRVPGQMYVTNESLQPLLDADYTDYAEGVGTIAVDETAERYYYVGEDFEPTLANRTVVEISGTRSGAPKTIEVVIGGDPNVTDGDRDYSLLRNHNYTYNVVLK